MNRAFPLTVTELMDLLEELHPEPAPKPGDHQDKIMFDAGRRSVVLGLRALREQAVPAPLREKRGQGRVRRQST